MWGGPASYERHFYGKDPADDHIGGHHLQLDSPDVGLQHASPSILSHDQVFRAEEGDSLVLPCSVSNIGNFVLMWKKGSRVLTAGTMVVRKDNRIRLADNFALELSQLMPEDEGVYRCEIDVMGRPLSIEHSVSTNSEKQLSKSVFITSYICFHWENVFFSHQQCLKKKLSENYLCKSSKL